MKARRTSTDLLDLLMARPLSIEDIARVLRIDEVTAALVLRLLRDAGRVRLETNGKWTVLPSKSAAG